ncbi:MAG: hypothetical protein H7Y12_11615 [Sphingobacteriaceae bacterium]|nr:hypothetical protein [Cytophagaceae bacterium]
MCCLFVLLRRSIPEFRASCATQSAWFLSRMLLAEIFSLLAFGVAPVAAQPIAARPSVARPSVARPDSLLRLSPARQYVAIRALYYPIMATKDTSAAKRVKRELEALFQKEETERDRLQLQMVFLEVELLFDFHPERFLPRATALLQQAEAYRDTVLMARGHLAIGLFEYVLRKNYYLAFRHYGQAFELMRYRSEADFPGHDGSIYTIARANYDFFNYEKAIELGRTLHPVEKTVTLNMHHIFNTGLIGLSYLHRQRYDSARYYFEWGLRRRPIREVNNEAWVGIFNGNIGRALVGQGQPEAALPFLKKGLDYTTRTQVWDNVAPFGACLSTLYLPTRPDLAGYYAHLAHRAALRVGTPKFLYETHRALAAYYGKVGRGDLALPHADSAAVAKDRWQKELDVTLKHRAEMTLEAERHQARERLLREEKDRQVLLRNGLLLVLLLAAGIAYLLYTRRAMTARHRRAQAQAEQARSESELRAARAQLDQYVTSFREKNDLIGRITAELAEASEPYTERRNERMAALLDSVILTDADWQRFRLVFEQVHPGFFEDLRHTHPDLTPAEVRLVALSKLGIPTADMALMLGVSAESIRKGRYRLRRKLEPEGADETLLNLLRPV